MKGVDPLAGWVPLFVRGMRGEVTWGYMGEERFTAPFCHETLQGLANRPFNQLFRCSSGLDLLLQRAEHHPGLPLRGIVFHMSRCGSTLAAQWLAALPDSVVLSEPEALGVLLGCLPAGGGEAVLRGLLAAMGQPRREGDRSLYLKADSMHILHIDRLLEAFPGTPWAFIYRDPVEVLVSHRRSPIWMQMLGSMQASGLQPPAEIGDDPEGYTAWMLAAVLQRAGQAATQHANGLLLNYAEMPQALERIGAHFGVDPAAAGMPAMRDIAGRHAKRPDQPFRPDSDEKHAAADARLRELAERWLAEPYGVLEQMRCCRAASS